MSALILQLFTYLQNSVTILGQFITYILTAGFYFGENFVLNALGLQSFASGSEYTYLIFVIPAFLQGLCNTSSFLTTSTEAIQLSVSGGI